jgi:hypothetical protein
MKILLIAYGTISSFMIVLLVVLYFKRKRAKKLEDFEKRDN